MAKRKSRSNRHPGQSTPLITYTVTIGHEHGAECDACGMPRPVLIEQENDAWICEICAGQDTGRGFWRDAVINGVYSFDGGGL